MNERRRRRLDLYTRAVTAIAAASDDLRLDANETAAFARQLEDIDARLYEVELPDLKGSLLVPVKSDINVGAEEYTYRVITHVGESKIIADYADDLPRTDVQGREVSNKLFGHGASYGWSVQDLRRAQMNGMHLDAERARAAREVIARKNDYIIAFGDTSAGVTGFTNNADVALVTPTTGTWSSATAEQIVEDLLKLERAPFVGSKGVETPDTMALPPSLFAIAATKKLANTETTALEFFLKKSLFVKNVEHWYHLETAGASSVPRIVCYKRDPTKVQALLPLEFQQQPPLQRNLSFIVNCDSRCGGVIWRYPGSARYMDGC